MKEIIEKVSSYNIFNNLYPGVVFIVLICQITTYDIPINNEVILLFLSYFTGMILSRIGSVAIEPIIDKMKLYEKQPYKEYINAVQKDAKIETLLESSNTFRTLISTIVSILIVKIYNLIEIKFSIDVTLKIYIFLVIVLIIFVISFIKNTNFIIKRIIIHNDN